jgi:hypothetical protein
MAFFFSWFKKDSEKQSLKDLPPIAVSNYGICLFISSNIALVSSIENRKEEAVSGV